MNLTVDEMLRLAKKTYPGQKVEARDHRVYVRPPHGVNTLPDMVLFSPSLTGEDWQVAQAVAVLRKLTSYESTLDRIVVETHRNTVFYAIQTGDLEASARALLGKEQS